MFLVSQMDFVVPNKTNCQAKRKESQKSFLVRNKSGLSAGLRFAIAAISLLVSGLEGCSVSTSCDVPEALLRKTSDLRALNFKKDVPCQHVSREVLQKRLVESLYERNSPEALRSEGEVFRALGLIPADYDYVEGVIENYASRMVGYYDSRRSMLSLSEKLPQKTQNEIISHELTHALQDQHFGLEQMFRPGLEGDSVLALTALVEGDAYVVSLLARDNQSCAEISTQNPLLEFRRHLIMSSHAAVPRALQLLMQYPYIYGSTFVCAARRRNALDDVFKNPPLATEQIMHPAKYFSSYEPVRDFAESSASEESEFSDVLGEYTVFSFLATYLTLEESQTAATGWAGDRIWLFKESVSGQPRMLWRLAWDSEKDSEEFYVAAISYFSSMFQKSAVIRRADAVFEETSLGSVRVQIDGLETRIGYNHGIR